MASKIRSLVKKRTVANSKSRSAICKFLNVELGLGSRLALTSYACRFQGMSKITGPTGVTGPTGSPTPSLTLTLTIMGPPVGPVVRLFR